VNCRDKNLFAAMDMIQLSHQWNEAYHQQQQEITDLKAQVIELQEQVEEWKKYGNFYKGKHAELERQMIKTISVHGTAPLIAARAQRAAASINSARRAAGLPPSPSHRANSAPPASSIAAAPVSAAPSTVHTPRPSTSRNVEDVVQRLVNRARAECKGKGKISDSKGKGKISDSKGKGPTA